VVDKATQEKIVVVKSRLTRNFRLPQTGNRRRRFLHDGRHRIDGQRTERNRSDTFLVRDTGDINYRKIWN
jgi:hypothetical protein